MDGRVKPGHDASEFGTVPALRSGMKMPHRVRDTRQLKRRRQIPARPGYCCCEFIRASVTANSFATVLLRTATGLRS